MAAKAGMARACFVFTVMGVAGWWNALDWGCKGVRLGFYSVNGISEPSSSQKLP
jgi:hypothetical protein